MGKQDVLILVVATTASSTPRQVEAKKDKPAAPKFTKCCFCGRFCKLGGCNPDPVNQDEDARCCHACDREIVLPARLAEIERHRRDN